MVVICAYCGHRGKGITLISQSGLMYCKDKLRCEKRAFELSPRQSEWLSKERHKLWEQQDGVA